MTTIPVITVDGPSGVGKGVLCKIIAKTLRWNFLDSGAIYRVLALAALHCQTDIFSEELLVTLANCMDISFIYADDELKVILEGENVSDKIRTQKIANIASRVATFPRVREALLHRQQAFREPPGLIADGRDMGTVVFHDAQVKIFLNASLEERARRRMLQLQKSGFTVNFKSLLSEIKKRDDLDRYRDVAPLVPAKDALVLDSTNLTVEQVIKRVIQYVNQKLTVI